MNVTMMRQQTISTCFIIILCFMSPSAIAESWRCEPKSGVEKLGLSAPKDLFYDQIHGMNFIISDGELHGTIVSDDPYSFHLKSNYTSARYRTFSDVSRWTTHIFKMHGTFDVGSVVDVRRSLISYDLVQVFDYLCVRRL